MAGTPRQVSGLTWKTGRAELTVKSGVADRVMANGTCVGLYFTGAGSFRYVSTFQPDIKVFRYNGENSSTPMGVLNYKWEEKDGSLGAAMPVEDGLVLGAPESLLNGPAATDADLDKAFQEHAKRFRLDFQVGQLTAPYWHGKEELLAYASRNAPGKAAAVAELRSGKFALIYRLDEAWSKVEALDAIHVEFHNNEEYHHFQPLSFQPLGWKPGVPSDPRYILKDVDLKLTAEPTGMAALTAVETVVPFEAMRVLPLRLNSKLYRFGARLWEASPVRVTSVTDAAGRALAFHHGNNDLLVDLGRTASPDEVITLRVEIQGRLLFNPDNVDCFKFDIEPWFPLPEASGEYYTLRAEVRTPKAWVAVSGGETIKRSEEDGMNVMRVAFNRPVCNYALFIGKFVLTEEVFGKRRINVASYVSAGVQSKQIAKLANAFIDLYGEILAPFPYDEFVIVQDRDLGYGQAPPGMMILSDEAFEGKTDDFAKFFTHGLNQRIAHEVAHQYWGGLLKTPSAEEEWLDEAFAEYMSGEAMKFVRGKGDSAFDGVVGRWKVNAEFAAPLGPIPMANRIHLAKDRRHSALIRFALLYGKGPFLLQRIRERIGDKDFWRFMKSMQINFKDKFVTTDDVRMVLEAVTRQDFKPFFDKYYYGLALPPKGGQ
ncbi:M1 family metallopeptidase [Mesoterricola sediminis]|uniref:M1 family metallopeptidase n=1 Tax=Mesoterricola sediminis TaxID=2927980 RepID=UPI001FAE8183|nr:M1 family aminopeptidase [Mesoterricola sediminis]